MGRPTRITKSITEREKVAQANTNNLPENIFRNRGFILLFAAYGVSAMGDHISEIAVLKWMDASNAPNITQLQAMITFMFMLPFFVLGPINGMLADQIGRASCRERV